VAELAIRTIDCGIVAMVIPGYGGPSTDKSGNLACLCYKLWRCLFWFSRTCLMAAEHI